MHPYRWFIKWLVDKTRYNTMARIALFRRFHDDNTIKVQPCVQISLRIWLPTYRRSSCKVES